RARGDDELGAVAKLHRPLLERPHADLRALEVLQDADRAAALVRLGAHRAQRREVRVVVAVREVQSGHVHARVDEPADDVGRPGRGPERAYDLGASHSYPPYHTKKPLRSARGLGYTPRAMRGFPPLPYIVCVVFVAWFVTTSAACTVEREAPNLVGQDIRVTVIHTADIHSRLFPYRYVPNSPEQGNGLIPGNGPFGGIARIG